jgi:6-methylsalicylate decarboxylase
MGIKMKNYCSFQEELTRRNFLAGGLGLAVGAAATSALAAAQRGAGGAARRIDVHHHMLPQRHMDAVAAARESGRPQPWSPQTSLEEMDKNDIATAIVSLVQPGVTLGTTEQARALARDCNEYGAKMVKDYPGRFGFFASVPLPDTEGSLKEIAYSLDTLKADGINLFTSFGDKYLGDKSFWPVYEELNRRGAIVYTHPTQPKCCNNMVPGVTVSTIEYATDTSRTIASVLFSGTASQFPNIRWIWSHGGGTMPFLIGRYDRLAGERKDPFFPSQPNAERPQLQKFYYELAQANHPGALKAVTEIIPLDHLLFGTDFPIWRTAESVGGVSSYTGFNDAQRHSVNRGNAERLFPRFKS